MTKVRPGQLWRYDSDHESCTVFVTEVGHGYVRYIMNDACRDAGDGVMKPHPEYNGGLNTTEYFDKWIENGNVKLLEDVP